MEPHRTHMGPIFEEKQPLPQHLGWGRSHTWVSAQKQLLNERNEAAEKPLGLPNDQGWLASVPLVLLPALYRYQDGTVQSSGCASRVHSTEEALLTC